ncbi:hypothetical protein [Nocardia alni]|uniref:hypothetical protein n=1 Tax=Nocardia alni TaxID=2815723 RepID=UPI001C2481BF|nr:hypothetical protein [Nocardia alni]
MTYADLGHRMTKLENRVTDIEVGHSQSIYGLTRDVRGLTLDNRRLIGSMNSVGHNITRIMAHLGIPAVPYEEITTATDAEIDASFEEEL